VLLDFYKGKNENELIYLKNGLFKIVDYPNLLKFNFIDGNVTSVLIIRDHLTVEIPIARK
jgi:hypothetical protein